MGYSAGATLETEKTEIGVETSEPTRRKLSHPRKSTTRRSTKNRTSMSNLRPPDTTAQWTSLIQDRLATTPNLPTRTGEQGAEISEVTLRIGATKPTPHPSKKAQKEIPEPPVKVNGPTEIRVPAIPTDSRRGALAVEHLDTGLPVARSSSSCPSRRDTA